MATDKKMNTIIRYFFLTILLSGIAFWLNSYAIHTDRQKAGLIALAFGYLLLFCFVFSKLLKNLKLPLITGYIFAGAILGPHISGFLDFETVKKFGFVNDLALSFIAMNAGGELHLIEIRKRLRVLVLNVVFQVAIIFGCIYFYVIYSSGYFSFTKALLPGQIIALAVLLGVIAIARSPASTIAIINETRAKGRFTETVLGVTVLKDFVIIVLFTIAISITKIILTGAVTINYYKFLALFGEIGVAIIIGVISGRCLSIYIEKFGHDIILFLLFFGFGITKLSLWLSGFMEDHFEIAVHFEPLLICISTGFTIQNFSNAGIQFLESLDSVALPIYIIFFALAGASLDVIALKICWPLAVGFVIVRLFGIFISTWSAGWLSKDPTLFNRSAWMAYLTQAGVAIGLAQLAGRRFPDIGKYLTTVVLAVIFINQIIGPILFKKAVYMVGEAKNNET